MDNEKEWEKLAGFFKQIDDWEHYEEEDEEDED